MYGGGAMFFPIPDSGPCKGCGAFKKKRTTRDGMALCPQCEAVEQAGGLQVEVGMRVFLKGSTIAYAVLEITDTFDVILREMDANLKPIRRSIKDISYRSVWF